MKSFFFSLFAAVVFPCSAVTAPITPTEEIRIGVFDTFEPEFWPQTLGPALEQWRKALPQYRITTVELSADQADTATDQNLSFFISSAFLYWSAHLTEGASAVAVHASPDAPTSALSSAGVIAVRQDSPLRTLNDLKGAQLSLAVPSDHFNAEFLAVKGTLAASGIEPEDVFKAIRPVGWRNPGVLSALASGAVDAGILRRCELEEALANGTVASDTLRVLTLPGTENERCRRSTERYPNMVLAAIPATSATVVTDIASVAYAMKLQNGARWLSASDFTVIDRMSRVLAFGPYAYLQEWTPQALWKRFSPEILLGLALIAAVLWHITRVNRLVLRRTRELREALHEKDVLEARARESREQLTVLEKTSLINQMSSLIAHELKQPLGTIANYCAGLSYHLKTPQPDLAMTAEIVAKMREQAVQAADIIEYVRSYAKKSQTPHPFVKTNLRDISAQAMNTLQFNFRGTCRWVNDIRDDAFVLADGKGLELVLYNLLKNGAEACRNVDEPQVALNLTDRGTAWEITVTDNGPALTNHALQRMAHPHTSLKAEGLGLGLTLVRHILERNRGKLSYRRNSPCGLTAVVTLPKLQTS